MNRGGGGVSPAGAPVLDLNISFIPPVARCGKRSHHGTCIKGHRVIISDKGMLCSAPSPLEFQRRLRVLCVSLIGKNEYEGLFFCYVIFHFIPEERLNGGPLAESWRVHFQPFIVNIF